MNRPMCQTAGASRSDTTLAIAISESRSSRNPMIHFFVNGQPSGSAP
jgi:hypothetical protein